MSAALNPVTDALKDRVISVVVCDEEPFAVRLEKVTAVVGALTVTLQVAVLLPSSVVTVMVAVPALTAVIVPPDTVATVGALVLHVTFLFVALEGATVAVNVSILPTVIVVDDLFKDTPVTSTGGGAVTVTVQAAVLLPLAVVTVITALPTDTPITTPFVTVATAVLLLLHVTF
jgi:hypothetical protein